ncbi:hypothetical protein GPJ56_004194 [Histomonas meleagridis]|uniref:uncharacterized protein n=1 Tax=Histomonas meleagridis TaxID=135588 RepID=UPI00355A408A|nr:hypothetical protein GPJ56_004194 [Histomonas meleagridis]KAH0801536.1 hypothetical protein GO595_005672 [Histomonas meleagridis]
MSSKESLDDVSEAISLSFDDEEEEAYSDIPKKKVKLQISGDYELNEDQEFSSSNSSELAQFIEESVPTYQDHSLDNLVPSNKNNEQKETPSKPKTKLQISGGSEVFEKQNSLSSSASSNSNELVQFIETNIPKYQEHSFDNLVTTNQDDTTKNDEPHQQIHKSKTATDTKKEMLTTTPPRNNNELVHYIESSVPAYKNRSFDNLISSNETKKIHSQEYNEFLARQEKSNYTKALTPPPPKTEKIFVIKSYVSKRSKQILKEIGNKPRAKPKNNTNEEVFTFHPKFQSDPKLRENAKELVSKRKKEKEEKEKKKIEIEMKKMKKVKPKESPEFNRKLLSILHKFDIDAE